MKKKKVKVRTTAQRRAAAKAAWALRKLKTAELPTATVKGHKTTVPSVDFAKLKTVDFAGTHTTAAATREGSELYVTISSGGAVHRFPVARDTMRKLGLDCLQLVG